MEIPQKPPRNKLTDTILNSRWFVLAMNGIVVCVTSFAAYADFTSEKYALFGMMCFLTGLIISGMVYTAMMPGLFRTFTEVEGTIMRAQIEKQMRDSLEEIKKQHPEIADIQILRVQ